MSWNLFYPTNNIQIVVTPFTGVWVEILYTHFKKLSTLSRPSRACELKLVSKYNVFLPLCHALHGRVSWNNKSVIIIAYSRCHALHGRVSWNCIYYIYILTYKVTPFTGVWVEMMMVFFSLHMFIRHALHGRVSWNHMFIQIIKYIFRHALHGRVSWNLLIYR